jgi:hypothetical protein
VQASGDAGSSTGGRRRVSVALMRLLMSGHVRGPHTGCSTCRMLLPSCSRRMGPLVGSSASLQVPGHARGQVRHIASFVPILFVKLHMQGLCICGSGHELQG